MKIRPIFADRLLAFVHDDQTDEFERLFDCWQDPEFLNDFFIENESDLKSGFFEEDITIKAAIFRTRNEAKKLEKKLIDLSTNENYSLNSIFKPLNREIRFGKFEKTKAYGELRNSWLRIYALKIDSGIYIVTGGAIKLTQRMSDRAHTQLELNKMQRCLDYLKEIGIYDIEGFKEIEL